MRLYLDITEFLTNPIRTGIQRITGELCRYAPPNTMTPVRFFEGGYIELPRELLDSISSYFMEPGDKILSEIKRLSSPEGGRRINFVKGDVALIPEVFDNPGRIEFLFSKSPAQLSQFRFVVYDLLPLTHPAYFVGAGNIPICSYYRLLRLAPNCAFISEYTGRLFHARLCRKEVKTLTVLPLGCDALGSKPEVVRLNRPLHFVVLGTLEPRKNHQLILEAFRPLLRDIEGLSLTFIGRMGWVEESFARQVLELAAEEKSRFNFLRDASDETIRALIEACRSTIYISTAEGYGLPPVESLWLGTPVIASSCIPSLENIGSCGVHYLDRIDVLSLRRAVFAYQDDHYANEKAREAYRLALPSWSSFVERVLTWCYEL